MTTGKRLPYPGLRAFHRDESDLFFGREGHVDKMVDRLTETRFLAVLGPSGGGKSSLVKTGLLDALDLGYSKAGTAWCVAYMKPGGAPIRNLAAGLLAAVSVPAEPVDVDMLAALLRRGPRSIAEWAGNGNLPRNYCLLILADQFEELFRYGDYAGREEAEAFVKLLLEAARTEALPLYVCITMRSEFLGACSMIPGLAEAINDGLYLTPRLSREQCEEAIAGPAGVCGFDVEPDLVNKILNDMAAMAPWSDDAEDTPQRRLSQRADQLPLMQHVLNRMWLATSAASGGERPLLMRKDYEALGGLRGALDIHGEEILAELGPNRRRTAEGVFRALTTGVSLENAVRRPCTVAQLVAEVQDEREDVLAMIEAFRAPSANFLQPPHPIPIDDSTLIDISHESLIRQWSTLSQWFMAEAQSAASWRDLLASTERYGGGRGDLLSGLDLAQASAWWAQDQPSREWAKRHGGGYDAVRDFLRQSEAERDREKIAAEERGWRERKRLKFQLAASVAACLIVGGLGVTSFVMWQSAKAKTTELQASRDALRQAMGRSDRLATVAEMARRSSERAESIALTAAAAQRQQRIAAQAAAAAQRRAEISARQAAAAAQANAGQARQTEQLIRSQIEEIGEIITRSDAGYNISLNGMRDGIVRAAPQLAPWLAARRSLRPARPPGAAPITATTFRGEVAEVLGKSLTSLARSRATPTLDRLAHYDRLYNAYQRAGRVEEAMTIMVEGWTFAETMLGSRQWTSLPLEERILVLEIGYQMGWFGPAVGQSAEADHALEALRRISAGYDPAGREVVENPRLAMALADYENLEAVHHGNRTFPPNSERAQYHALRAVDYAQAARAAVTDRAAPGAVARSPFSQVTRAAVLGREVKLRRNAAVGLRGASFVQETNRACGLAKIFHHESPEDERALAQMADCADLQATINPRTITAQVDMVGLLSPAIRTDGRNPTLRGLSVLLGSRAITIYRDQRREGCDSQCTAAVTATVREMGLVFSQGLVPTNESHLNVMMDLLDRISDNEERVRLSGDMARAMQPMMAQPHARLLFDEQFARAFVASGQSLRNLTRFDEAEREFRRAADVRRGQPVTLSLLADGEINQQCWIESELIALQVNRGMREEALATARAIHDVCERYLDTVAPWSLSVREYVVTAYQELLKLDWPAPEDVVRNARRFVEQFGFRAGGSRFNFRYFVDRSGSIAPRGFSFAFREVHSTARSQVDDFLENARLYGTRLTPGSAVDFLRQAEASARRQGRPFPEIAQAAMARATAAAAAEAPTPGEFNVAQLNERDLDALYRRASALLRGEAPPVTGTTPTAH